MHAFEKAGLGKAPFKCVGVTENMWTSGCGTVTKPGGSCDYCGTGIRYEYWIVGATGSKFKVGCDCVLRTASQDTVADFKKVKAQHEKAKRDVKKAAQRAQWKKEREERDAARAAELPAMVAAFRAANPDFVARLETDTSSFAKDLLGKLNGWGSLTQPQMDAIKRGWAREDAKAYEKANSQHIGVVKARVSDVFTVQHYTSKRADFYPYPTSYWHLLKDSKGNVCTYRGSTWLGNRGDTVQATFTVKEHGEYDGTKQTVLARPKIVEHAPGTTVSGVEAPNPDAGGFYEQYDRPDVGALLDRG
jgi:hypothetical protein